MAFKVGETAVVPLEFRDRLTGELVDPTTLTASVSDPSGTVVIYTYGVGSQITRTSTGRYRLAIDLTAHKRWHFKIRTTGVGKGAAEGFIDVDKPHF